MALENPLTGAFKDVVKLQGFIAVQSFPPSAYAIFQGH